MRKFEIAYVIHLKLNQIIMKKLLLIAFSLIITSISFAQPPGTLPAKPSPQIKSKQTASPAAYACPKCYNIDKKEGKCEHCNVDKVKLGTYYCMHCMKSAGNKPGKCEGCKMATTQITRKYCAQHKMKNGDMKHEDKMKAEKPKGE